MTHEDDKLRDLFQEFNPEFNDNDKFMTRLNHKLDAIEYIKRMQDAQLRRYKYAIILAMILGIISGGVIFAMIISNPLQEPLFSFGIESHILNIIEQNSRLLSDCSIASAISICIVILINSINALRETAMAVPLREEIA